MTAGLTPVSSVTCSVVVFMISHCQLFAVPLVQSLDSKIMLPAPYSPLR